MSCFRICLCPSCCGEPTKMSVRSSSSSTHQHSGMKSKKSMMISADWPISPVPGVIVLQCADQMDRWSSMTSPTVRGETQMDAHPAAACGASLLMERSTCPTSSPHITVSIGCSLILLRYTKLDFLMFMLHKPWIQSC